MHDDPRPECPKVAEILSAAPGVSESTVYGVSVGSLEGSVDVDGMEEGWLDGFALVEGTFEGLWLGWLDVEGACEG